ncbi:hypothetical protein BCR39DRAFT_585968 [Naematelia encephala]|uniref:LysM domain-containing protein n=1 Tax=Naematelia encephala TaxID=71784 RepID=A0A1Y2BJT8_9TREE|nr:hypothetical protein BCR39DRAFT_585968 [Naematelia encephala]
MNIRRKMSYCQTCYTELRPSESVYTTPCCSSPICSRCITRNPRLKEYSPCLRCGDVRTDIGNRAIRDGRLRLEEARRSEHIGQFTIGDDDDEVEIGDEDAPPGYTSDPEPPTKSDKATDTRARHGGAENEEELQAVEVRHPVSRSDTILSIARRYAADPHEILSLNNLPPSTLSTQPHLLRTRQTLLISRRLMPKSKLPSSTLFSTPADKDYSPYEKKPEHSDGNEDEARRAEERRVKRFQLITKTADPCVGRAYVGLAAAEESASTSDGIGFGGSGEGMGGKKTHLPQEGNRAERAVERFLDDDEWEREWGGPARASKGVDGRWKVVGSGLKLGLKA